MSQQTITRCDVCGATVNPDYPFHMDHPIVTTWGQSSDFCSLECLRKWLDARMPANLSAKA